MPSQNPFPRFLRIAGPFLVLLVLATTGLAQGDEVEAPAVGGHADKTLLETIIEGGPLLMLIWVSILATSITMVTLIIQNIITLKPNRLAPPPLVQSLQQTIAAGNYQEAWEICRQNNNYLANVLRAALTRLGRGKEAVEDAIAEHGLREATLPR
jgi:hypothetical protein